MKLIRFMSAAEAIFLLRGDELKNDTDHRKLGQRTTSIGFCFAVVSDQSTDGAAIYGTAKRLSGISVLELCLVAKLKPSKNYSRSTGHYSTGKERELCTTHYSLKDFEEWRLYSPTGRSPIMPAWSGDYVQPVLIAEK